MPDGCAALSAKAEHRPQRSWRPDRILQQHFELRCAAGQPERAEATHLWNESAGVQKCALIGVACRSSRYKISGAHLSENLSAAAEARTYTYHAHRGAAWEVRSTVNAAETSSPSPAESSTAKESEATHPHSVHTPDRLPSTHRSPP